MGLAIWAAKSANTAGVFRELRQSHNRGLHQARLADPRHPFNFVFSFDAAQNGEQVFPAAGTNGGQLTVWNFLSGDLIQSRRRAHVDAVRALAFGAIDEQVVLASGGDDGVLRLWTTALVELFHVEIGEPIKAITWMGTGRIAVGSSRGIVALEWRAGTFR